MIEIVASVGLVTFGMSLLSSRYHNARDGLQPKWWYALVAISMVCYFIVAFLIYEEYPILAIILFALTCGMSYLACKLAILHDKIDRIRKRLE